MTPDSVAEICRRILATDEVDALIVHGFGRLAQAQGSAPDFVGIPVEMEKSVVMACANLADETDKPIVIGSAILPSQSRVVRGTG